MDDPAKLIAETILAFDQDYADSDRVVTHAALSAERAAAIVDALKAAGIRLEPERDPELLRAEMIRSIYRFTYLVAVVTPAGLAWQLGHALATGGAPFPLATTFGLAVFIVGAALFGGFARAMKMFANPSRRQLRRIVARRDKEQARAEAEERQRQEQAAIDHRRTVAEMIDAAKKLGGD